MGECLGFAIELDIEHDSNTHTHTNRLTFVAKDQKFNEFLHTKKFIAISLSYQLCKGGIAFFKTIRKMRVLNVK